MSNTKSSKFVILIVALFQTIPYFGIMMLATSLFNLSFIQSITISIIVTILKLSDAINILLRDEKLDELNEKLDELIDSKK